MSFGISDAGVLSRTTSNTVQVADKLTEQGNIEESTSYGGTTEVTEETYTDSITNQATNAQNGADIITSHEFNEVSDNYARQTITTRSKI